VQTIIVKRFVDRVNACCSERLDVEHQFGGALYRDRDVLTALSQGKVAMGVVGTWQLDRLAPEVSLFMLPVFYGRSDEEVKIFEDGPVTEAISRQLERGQAVVVLGRWIGLGFSHIFSTRTPLSDVRDLAGLRIRTPGGVANSWRLASLGAEPMTIAWTDLPLALAEGRIDGLITTFASLDSVKLWERGIRFALEDREMYTQYVPLVSDFFWRQIDRTTRAHLRAAWESVVDEGRALAVQSQKEARDRAIAAGVRIVVPSPVRSATVRSTLSAGQPAIAARLGIDPVLLGRAAAAFGERP